ncbi:class I SAM-dependent methyltransferase [Methylobacter sp. Wu1]|uniref:class I SAM-dependent methyltransferase n=1 Tax=Methylobacter sp. Wu1 TaxID=3119359 RepID=UPI002F94E0C0
MKNLRSIMNGLVLKLKRAIHRHGFRGLLWIATERIVRLADSLRPSVRAEIRMRERRAAEFDQRFGVETGGLIHPTELSINSPNQIHSVSYGGSDPEFFRKAVEALPIDYHDFTFIDFGSGKGRAVLLAKEFAFQKIVGVEFCNELHAIAQDNLMRFRSELSKCENTELICADAMAYPLPDGCLVCYFCNPFDAVLMTHMLLNIRESFLQNPRDIFVVYYNPKEAHVIDVADCFTSVATVGPVRIWRTMPESQACPSATIDNSYGYTTTA